MHTLSPNGLLRIYVLAQGNNNNNGYFYVLFLQRAHSPFIYKKPKTRCKHRLRKNQQIKSTVNDAE